MHRIVPKVDSPILDEQATPVMEHSKLVVRDHLVSIFEVVCNVVVILLRGLPHGNARARPDGFMAQDCNVIETAFIRSAPNLDGVLDEVHVGVRCTPSSTRTSENERCSLMVRMAA